MNGANASGSRWLAYVGCRTTAARNASGKGISVFAVDTETGDWALNQVVEGLLNPSFLTLNRGGDRLYAVHGDHAEVSSFVVDPVFGTLEFLNRQSCNGTNPVHLELSQDGRDLIIANYGTGTLAALGVAANGSLNAVRSLIAMPGAPGPHRIEQTGSHPHHAPRFVNRCADTTWHIVPDKGLDAVFAVRIGANQTDTQIVRFQSRESAGPRHAAFHPERNLIYVANELHSTVSTLSFDCESGGFTCIDHVLTLPPNYSDPNRVAGIVMHPSGRMLYVSNRGHDSVACIPVDASGKPNAPMDFLPALGSFPRFITLTPGGRHLIVANERSHHVIVRSLDSRTFLANAKPVVIETPSPVCVVFNEPRKLSH